MSLGVGGTWVALAACAGVMELQWTCLRSFTGAGVAVSWQSSTGAILSLGFVASLVVVVAG